MTGAETAPRAHLVLSHGVPAELPAGGAGTTGSQGSAGTEVPSPGCLLGEQVGGTNPLSPPDRRPAWPMTTGGNLMRHLTALIRLTRLAWTAGRRAADPDLGVPGDADVEAHLATLRRLAEPGDFAAVREPASVAPA